MKQKDIIITGAGLVGSLLSIYLAKRGHKVRIYERRPDMRKEKMSAGRSINLALSDRGLLALEKLGLAKEILSIAIPMHGRSIHHVDGSTSFQPYGKEGQFINSVSRATLNMQLMDLAEKEGVEIFFNHKCTTIDWKNKTINFEHLPASKQFQPPTSNLQPPTSNLQPPTSNIQPSTSNLQPPTSNLQHPTSNLQPPTSSFDLLFGADGAFSATRLQHQLQHDKFDYQQYYIDCGYKELTIPPTPAGGFAMDINSLHIWPRKNYMLIALPNLDKSFTCTLFFPFEGEASFSKLDEPARVRSFFEKTFPDAVKLMPDYIDEFFQNPVSSLVTVKCYPWIRENSFALIGDAAHAIVPFFGQGMNCGFEDCRILDEIIGRYEDDWDTILQTYQQERKPDADAIADLAVGNFIEMRERTADPSFLLQKKIEAKLHDKYPDKWIPAYSQVTFNPQIRYSEALQKGLKQEAIMQKIMKQPGIEEQLDNEEFYQNIIRQVK